MQGLRLRVFRSSLHRSSRVTYRQFNAASNTVEPTIPDFWYNKQSSAVQKKTNELRQGKEELYPRITRDIHIISCANFKERYSHLKSEESRDGEVVTVYGLLSYYLIPLKRY